MTVTSASDRPNETKASQEQFQQSDLVVSINAIKSEVEALRGESERKMLTNVEGDCKGEVHQDVQVV